MFFAQFRNDYQTSLPLMIRKSKKKFDTIRSPWMTEYISKAVRGKNKLYKKYLRSPNKTNESKYKIYKNKLNHIIKIAKKKTL